MDAPAIDPTLNVRELVDEERRRQDDLRQLDSQWRDKMDALRASHGREIRKAEADRIDAIRAVDVGAVQRAAEVQADQATALAAQVTAAADAFRVSLAAETDPIKKDIADLRRVQYEQAGQKQQVVEQRASFTLGQGVATVLATLAIVGIGLYAALHTTSSSPSPTVVCTASYHPQPCP